MLVVCGVVLSGCSVGGRPQAAEGDLADRAVAATDFPSAAASRVPEQAVGHALADLTGSPIAGEPVTVVEPQDCTGPEISPQGAVIHQEIADDGRTLTAAVLHASEELDAYAARVSDCPQVTVTAATGAASVVEARLVPPPSVPDRVDAEAIRRDIEIGEGLDTTALSLIAQHDGVRVIVELRGGVDDPEATSAADELFHTALVAAFE